MGASRGTLCSVSCQYCGVSFLVKPSEVARGGGKYCGRECYQNGRNQQEASKSTVVTCSCETCGKVFRIKPHRRDRTKYCSKACMRIGQCGPKKPLEERFWEKVDKPSSEDACWLWTGSTVPFGYGQIGVVTDGVYRPIHAHRVSWELHNGPIPDGMVICHSCDNPPCVNPKHLFLGTSADNNADAWAKGRAKTPFVAGSHYHAKLTEAQVIEIRQRYSAGGVLRRELAAEYGVSLGCIASVVSGRNWHYLIQNTESITEQRVAAEGIALPEIVQLEFDFPSRPWGNCLGQEEAA